MSAEREAEIRKSQTGDQSISKQAREALAQERARKPVVLLPAKNKRSDRQIQFGSFDEQRMDHEEDYDQQAVRTASGEADEIDDLLRPSAQAVLDGPQLRYRDRKWRVDTVAEFTMQQGTDSVRARLEATAMMTTT